MQALSLLPSFPPTQVFMNLGMALFQTLPVSTYCDESSGSILAAESAVPKKNACSAVPVSNENVAAACVEKTVAAASLPLIAATPDSNKNLPAACVEKPTLTPGIPVNRANTSSDDVGYQGELHTGVFPLQ